MLSKYHNLPDHFHDLKTLQAEFDLLKTATSKNIQNIQEVVQSQQAYTTVLSGHINTLYTKLAHLDKQVQIHCRYPHPQLDMIQLNVPDYYPDIDGDTEPVTDIQSPDAKPSKEDNSTGTPRSEDHTPVSAITNRPEHQPSEVSTDIDINEHDNIEQQRAEHPSDYHPQFDGIPELETDEDNWDNSQFDDAELLYNHKSTEESDRIHREYSAYFEKLKIKNTALTILCKELKTIFLSLIITMPIYNQNSTRDSKTKMSTYLQPPLLKIYVYGMGEAEGEPASQKFHGHRLYGEKTRPLESQLA